MRNKAVVVSRVFSKMHWDKSVTFVSRTCIKVYWHEALWKPLQVSRPSWLEAVTFPLHCARFVNDLSYARGPVRCSPTRIVSQ